MRAASLVAGSALCAALLAACDSETTEPPFLPETSPTPSPSPTVSPTATPTPSPIPTPTAGPTAEVECDGMDCFRRFAVLIDTALVEGDGAFFAERVVEEEVTCTGDEGLGPCAEQPAGTVVSGLPVGVAASEGTLLEPDDYVAIVEDWLAAARPDATDGFGSGGVTLYALGYAPPNPYTGEGYLAVVTGIFTSGPSTLRQARIMYFDFFDRSWRLTFELFATVPQTTNDWLSGECSECYDRWERWEGAP